MNRNAYFTYDLLLLNNSNHPGYGGGRNAEHLASMLLKSGTFLKEAELVRRGPVEEGYLLAGDGLGLLIRDTPEIIPSAKHGDPAWGHLVRVFWKNLAQIGNMREELVHFLKTTANITTIRVTADDVSDYAIEELSPLISRLENGLRRALVKYYSLQLGLGSVADQLDPYLSRVIKNRVEDKLKMARRAENEHLGRFWSHLESDIREMGFEDLGALVFSPTSASRYLEATLIKMVRAKDREERVRHWDVFMGDHSISLHRMMDTAGFRYQWYQMNALRNLVAHNSLIGLAQIEEGRKLYKELMDRILAFEQQMPALSWPIDEDRFRESLDNYMAAVAVKETEAPEAQPKPAVSQTGIKYFSNLLQLSAPTMVGKIELPKERRGAERMRKDALNISSTQALQTDAEKRQIWNITDERDISDDTWLRWLRDDLEFARKEHGHQDLGVNRFVNNICRDLRGITPEVTNTALRRLESIGRIQRYSAMINGYTTQCIRTSNIKKGKKE